MNLEDGYEIAQDLIDFYRERNLMYGHMEDMYYGRWEFPEGMPDWVIKVVSTDPHDAIQTTVRTFATDQARFKVAPMNNNQNNRDQANKIETALTYNFTQAARRSDASVLWDVMFSASMFADVVAQVVYLPYQEKILKAMGKDTARIKAAKRFGDFAFIVHHPSNIYPTWSEYGLESVLAVRVQSVDEFMATWGEKANDIVTWDDYQKGRITYVTSYDYIDYQNRTVWGVCSDNADLRVEGRGIKILDKPNELGFIPYAIKRWGNSLSADPRERVKPMLQSVYDSGQWKMLNVFESLDSSLAMKRAARPEFAGEFPVGQEPVIDNTEPSGVARIPQGTRNFQPLPAQSVDNRVAMQKEGFRSSIWQSSVSRVLTALETGNRESYSSFNQRLTAAANSLAPYRMLSEGVLAEIAHQTLCWMKYYGKEYGKGEDVNLYGMYTDKTRAGETISIPYDEINPDALQITCQLTATMPVDKLQQINGAVMLKNNFTMVPEADLLEDIVGGDPVEMSKRRKLEDYENTYIGADLKRITDAQQLETQGQMMQMQAGIQQQQQAMQQQAMQQQAMQQEQQARQQEAATAAAANGQTPAQGAMQGNSPNQGGVPPVQMARGQK